MAEETYYKFYDGESKEVIGNLMMRYPFGYEKKLNEVLLEIIEVIQEKNSGKDIKYKEISKSSYKEIQSLEGIVIEGKIK